MKKIISNIVFTKNRPLQLDAYLESLYNYFPSELIQTYILYKAELFEDEYKQLFRKYANCIVIKESRFYRDLSNLLSEISTKYVLFGVDDVVYFDSVDFDVVDETFNKFSRSIFGFSLRFGEESIKDGGDTVCEAVSAGQRVFSIDWTQGQTPNTRYPFELCATIYTTALIKRIMHNVSNSNVVVEKLFSPGSALMKALGRIISKRSVLRPLGYFYDPNTLEAWYCRWCRKNPLLLPPSLYFQKLCASAIQVNMVNTSTANTTDGSDETTVEALAEKYRLGHRLDIDFVAQNKPMGIHSGKQYFKLTSNRQVSMQ